jgi:hypothetical protein
MSISLQIEESGLPEEDLQEITRELCQTINDETEISAELQVGESVPGSRGEPITIGVIALAFLTSGAAVALFKVIKAYFERNRSLKIIFKRSDGETLELGAENLSADQIDDTIAMAKAFVG